MVLYLDAHCEATIGWLEPLAQRIKNSPKTFVIPSIDGIDDRTLAFHGSVVSKKREHGARRARGAASTGRGEHGARASIGAEARNIINS